MINTEKLLKAMEDGKQDLATLIASELFLNRDGTPNEEVIKEFEFTHGHKIETKEIPCLGIWGGTIKYQGNKYYFG